MSSVRLVFDIGGTNMRIALAEDDKIKVGEKLPTPHDPKGGIDAIRSFLEQHDAHPSEAAGGIASTVKDGATLYAPNLREWNDFRLIDSLKEICGIERARLLNDAEAAGIGEARVGAGKDHRVVAYVTVSTGIGGALIVDGSSVPHAIGHEPGKQIIDYTTMTPLDRLAEGASLEKEFGKPPQGIPRDVYEERTRVLAAGFYNLLCLWSPDIIVVGGGLMNDKTGYSLEAIVKELSGLPVRLPPLPPVVHAALGDDSGLIGAALVSLED